MNFIDLIIFLKRLLNICIKAAICLRDRLTLPKHAATYNRDGCLVFLLLHVHDEYLITWALTAHDLEDIKIQIEIQCIYLLCNYCTGKNER